MNAKSRWKCWGKERGTKRETERERDRDILSNVAHPCMEERLIETERERHTQRKRDKERRQKE